MVSYDLLLFILKIETSTGGTTLCHSSFSGGIICRSYRGSFAVRDHLRSNLGIISSLGIICGRGSFAALYSCARLVTLQLHFRFFFFLLFSDLTSTDAKPTRSTNYNTSIDVRWLQQADNCQISRTLICYFFFFNNCYFFKQLYLRTGR